VLLNVWTSDAEKKDRQSCRLLRCSVRPAYTVASVDDRLFIVGVIAAAAQRPSVRYTQRERILFIASSSGVDKATCWQIAATVVCVVAAIIDKRRASERRAPCVARAICGTRFELESARCVLSVSRRRVVRSASDARGCRSARVICARDSVDEQVRCKLLHRRISHRQGRGGSRIF